MKPTFDEQDQSILTQRQQAFDTREGPRVGDFVIFPDGTYNRFSHDWGNDIQTSKGGSFYLSKSHMSFSGGLDPAIDKGQLTPLSETRNGQCWFFHHDYHTAHNGVDTRVKCRVFAYGGQDKRF